MMLTACGSAGKSPPDATATKAALTLQVDRVKVCPAELDLAMPARAQPPAGAILRANPDADAYLDAKDAREDELEQRLVGAKAECERQRGRP